MKNLLYLLYLLLPLFLLLPGQANHHDSIFYTLVYPVDANGDPVHVTADGTLSVSVDGGDSFHAIERIHTGRRGYDYVPVWRLTRFADDALVRVDLMFGETDDGQPLPYQSTLTVGDYFADLERWDRYDYVSLLPVMVEYPKTIAEIAVATPSLSTLVTAVTLASEQGEIDFLAAISDPDADLTVFAPTDAAFEALGDTLGAAIADPAGLLTQVLAYHVLGASATGAELLAESRATTLLGSDVMISADEAGNVFINDSQVVIANVQAANGIVHVIDAVLLPSDAPEPLPTIAEIAVSTPSLSTLVTAVTLASGQGGIDFLAAISDPDADLTVFAPTDAAFAALGDTLAAAIADPGGLLSQVLAYHVLGSSESGADLVAAGTAMTLLGPSVRIAADADGNVFINDSQVVIANVRAANGIVHVIDAVLLPPTGPIIDGAVIELKGKVNKRYLGANAHRNVIAEGHSSASTKWKIEDLGDGTFRLLNETFGLYLDADSAKKHYNVDLGRAGYTGTTWTFTELANGNYVLTATDYNRVLDGDFYNVDTSSHIRDDDEWSITLVP